MGDSVEHYHLLGRFSNVLVSEQEICIWSCQEILFEKIKNADLYKVGVRRGTSERGEILQIRPSKLVAGAVVRISQEDKMIFSYFSWKDENSGPQVAAYFLVCRT